MRLTPEAELVLMSAGIGTNPRWQALWGQPLKWSEIVAVAADERAAFVLSRKLPSEAPDEARAALRKLALVAEFRHAQLNQLIRTTLAYLDRHGIDAVLLKGGALIAHGIATTAERPMSDIDLLVAPERARDVWQRLQESGWHWDRDRFPADLYERQHHLPPLLDAAGSSYRLEVHRELFPPNHPFALTPNDIWNASRRVAFADVRPRVPDPSHLLVHTAIHFAWSHTFESKAWRTFRDVELLVARTAVDWDSLVNTAHGARAASCVYWTLRLARAAIGTPIPEGVLERLRPPRPEMLVRRLERHYARNMLLTRTRCPSDKLNRALWEAGICPKSQGHGDARPWDGSFRIPEVQAWEHARGRATFKDRLRQIRRLARYLGELR